jgi:hypothetical protein
MVLRSGEDYAQELETIFHNPDGAETISHFLCSLAIFTRRSDFRDALNEWGEFQRDIIDSQGLVNMIPFGKTIVHREFLMVFSKGGDEFDIRLEETLERCAADCPGITKGVLLVTDFWDNEKFWNMRSSTFEKLSVKLNVVLAAAIWTGNFFAVQRIIPQYI